VSNVKDKHKDLSFAYDAEINSIVVDYVPGVYGVRVGAKVVGYLQPGSTKVKEIKWPSKNGKKNKDATCTLTALMKLNGISKQNDTLVLETPCTYCTHLVKVDTKEFGLPQTRNRVYMFVWQPEDDNVYDDLVSYLYCDNLHLDIP
jgi:hypothetical protein